MNLACVMWYHYQWTQIPSWKKNKENTNLFLFRCKANTSLWNSNASMLLIYFFFFNILCSGENLYQKMSQPGCVFAPSIVVTAKVTAGKRRYSESGGKESQRDYSQRCGQGERPNTWLKQQEALTSLGLRAKRENRVKVELDSWRKTPG